MYTIMSTTAKSYSRSPPSREEVPVLVGRPAGTSAIGGSDATFKSLLALSRFGLSCKSMSFCGKAISGGILLVSKVTVLFGEG